MMYFVKSPWWLRKLYPKRFWKMDAAADKIYLTFDDGPHPEQTVFVLDELKKYHAKATFFCVGENVSANTALYQRILDEGHKTGNHTQHHLNGWKGDDEGYMQDVAAASLNIDSRLFRPPYGRLTSFREKLLREGAGQYKIIMWSVLSGDFDKSITPERCLDNVLLQAAPGDIIVFHDSEKASENLRYALPRVLAAFAEKNFKMASIEL